MRLQGIALSILLVTGLGTAALAEEKPIKVALIADKTGLLEAYAKQTPPDSRWGWNTPPAAPWRWPDASSS